MATKNKAKWVKLFVYGTLMTGCKLHGWLNQEDFAIKIADVNLYGHSLIDFGPYPALINCGEHFQGAVRGELWEVHPSLFKEIRSMEERVGYITEDVDVYQLEDKWQEGPIVAKVFVFAAFDPYATVKWNLKATDNPKTTEHIIKV